MQEREREREGERETCKSGLEVESLTHSIHPREKGSNTRFIYMPLLFSINFLLLDPWIQCIMRKKERKRRRRGKRREKKEKRRKKKPITQYVTQGSVSSKMRRETFSEPSRINHRLCCVMTLDFVLSLPLTSTLSLK